MTGGELARIWDATRTWDLAWQSGEIPPGPVELWVAVFDTDGEFMGAAQAPPRLATTWRAGQLAFAYTPLQVVMQRGGWYKTGVICAVNRQARAYRGLWPVSLGEPGELRPGDTITITDGVIAVTPDLPEVSGTLRP